MKSKTLLDYRLVVRITRTGRIRIMKGFLPVICVDYSDIDKAIEALDRERDNVIRQIDSTIEHLKLLRDMI